MLKAGTPIGRAWASLRARLARLPDGIFEALLAIMISAMPLAATMTRWDEDRLGLVLELLLCATAACVGRWPVPAAFVSAALLAALLALPLDVRRPALIAVLVIVASLGARGFGWPRFALAGWYLIVNTIIENHPPQSIQALIGGVVGFVLLVSGALIIGEVLHRLTTEQARSVVDRTAAVHAQRRSIARDLHDTIAYSTTSIILRAEQAKLRGVDDPELLLDLDYIINAGRNSMRDLRGMMETLRRNEAGDSEPTRSPWRIASLDEVLTTRSKELRQHGFSVTTHVDADASALPESVREALGKVVVEATSNMVKHGDPAGPVSILIEDDGHDVEAVFINKVRQQSLARVDTARLGLVGARERIEALGGEVQVASETPNWVVRVLIPLGG